MNQIQLFIEEINRTLSEASNIEVCSFEFVGPSCNFRVFLDIYGELNQRDLEKVLEYFVEYAKDKQVKFSYELDRDKEAGSFLEYKCTIVPDKIAQLINTFKNILGSDTDMQIIKVKTDPNLGTFILNNYLGGKYSLKDMNTIIKSFKKIARQNNLVLNFKMLRSESTQNYLDFNCWVTLA